MASIFILSEKALSLETPREYVQTMLGHKSPSSTAIYVHVTNKAIMGVKSPFDLPIEEDASKDNEGKGDE